MTPTRILLFVAPGALMLRTLFGSSPASSIGLAGFGSNADARMMLGRIGIALPYAVAAAIGIVFLFACEGRTVDPPGGSGRRLIGTLTVVAIAAVRERCGCRASPGCGAGGRQHLATTWIQRP